MFDISLQNSKTYTWHPIENSEGAGGMVKGTFDQLSKWTLKSWVHQIWWIMGRAIIPPPALEYRVCIAWLFKMTCGRCSFQAMSFWNRIQTKEIERVMLIGLSIQMKRIDEVDEIISSYVLLTYVLYIYIYTYVICHMSSLYSIHLNLFFRLSSEFPLLPKPPGLSLISRSSRGAFFGFLGINGWLH